jgi:hypothetical protein
MTTMSFNLPTSVKFLCRSQGHTNNILASQPKLAPHKSHVDGFQGAIISIGPQTDSILDRFDLDNDLVPCLRVLTQTIHSGKWEATLRTSCFGLTYEQAPKLTNAMLNDIRGEQGPTTQVCLNPLLMLVTDFLFVVISSYMCNHCDHDNSGLLSLQEFPFYFYLRMCHHYGHDTPTSTVEFPNMF